MTGLPTGTVTFLFTDIEGSTLLLEHLGDDSYVGVLHEHHRVLRQSLAAHRGVEVSTEGDAFFVAFGEASDAVACALAAQVGLGALVAADGTPVRVRMGLHTGPGRWGATTTPDWPSRRLRGSPPRPTGAR